MPFIGGGCALLGHIFLDRTDREACIRQLKKVRQELQPGTSILFFAEGTRSRDGQLQGFKKGAFQMAKDLNVAIFPVTVKGSDGMGLRPGRAQMIIHPPVAAETVAEMGCDDLLGTAREIIEAPLLN